MFPKILFNLGIKRANPIALASDIRAKTRNRISELIEPYCPPHNPAKIFPKKLVKNQVPISMDKNCLGASFETRDRPIEEIHSSAIVIMKYTLTSHNGQTR